MALINHFEQGPLGGPALTAYQDSGGVWTIGLGHAISPQDPLRHARITPDAAAALAQDDLDNAACEVEHQLGDMVAQVPEGVYAALIDFVFNEGAGNFHGSTLLRFLQHGNLDAACEELGRWVYGHVDGKAVKLEGLVKRRAAEQQVWKTGVWP